MLSAHPIVGVLTFCAAIFMTSASLMKMNSNNVKPHKGLKSIQVLKNEGDVQYSGEITLGGQTLNVIPDTGSFELVIFSDKCDRCGDNLYKSLPDKTLTEGTLQAEQSYGSGNTLSLEAYDDMELGHLSVKQQMFWEVIQVDMPQLEDWKFQGIFGLGAPDGNIEMAYEDVTAMEGEIQQMRDSGFDVAQYLPTVENAKEIAEFSKTEKLWIQNLQMHSFSICLGQASGSPGVFIYNDDNDASLFSKTVDVVGNTFWAAVLRDVEVAAEPSSGLSKSVSLGCTSKDGCQAILDTGTSFIAAPQAALDKMTNSLEQWSSVSGGCSDLSGLPDLTFTFGDEQFSLPPESYVGEMSGDIPDWALEKMPHLKAIKAERETRGLPQHPGETDAVCVPLFMSMDADPMWILGLPFFRKYYTNFKLSEDSKKGMKMRFAESDGHCNLGNSSSRLRVAAARTRGVPLRIDAGKLLPPRWRAGAVSRRKLPHV